MNDLDRRMKDALGAAGQSFRPGDMHRARARFVERRRRRVVGRVAGGLAMAAAAVLAAVLVVQLAPPLERRSTPAGPPVAPPGDSVVTARVATGSEPSGVAIGDQYVYVGKTPGMSVDPQLTVVDPAGNALVRARGSWPHSGTLAIDGDRAWVVWGDQLERWDVADLTTALDDPEDTRGEPVARVGDLVSDIATGGGYVWVASNDPDAADASIVTQVDAAACPPAGDCPDAIDTIAVSSPAHLDFGYGYLWAAHGSTLTRVDPDGSEPAELVFRTGTTITDVSVGAGGVWIYSSGPESSVQQATVRLLDPALFDAGDVSAEDLGNGAAASFDGFFGSLEATDDGVWVINSKTETDRELIRLDPADGDRMDEPLPLGAGPFEMASGFGSLWVSDQGAGKLLRVDIEDRASS